MYVVGAIALAIVAGTVPLIMNALKMMKDSVSSIHQDADLIAIGIEAQAVIQAVTETNTTYNNNPQVILDMRVIKEDGDSFNTRIKTVIPEINLPQYQAGKKVTVRYVEENGEKRVAVLGAYRLNK